MLHVALKCCYNWCQLVSALVTLLYCAFAPPKKKSGRAGDFNFIDSALGDESPSSDVKKDTRLKAKARTKD